MQLDGRWVARTRNTPSHRMVVVPHSGETSTMANWTMSLRQHPVKIRSAGADSLQLHPGEILTVGEMS